MRPLQLTLAVMVALLVGSAAFAQVGSTGQSEGATGQQQPVSRTYSLTVNSNVGGATIFIDGIRQREQAPATIRLTEGRYTISVEARGYEPYQVTVNLRSNQSIFARLESPTATVILEVPAAFLNNRIRDPYRMIDFYVNGRLRTEARVELEPGFHDITIVSGGLRFEDEFFFEAGRFYTLELLLRATLFSGSR